MQNTYRWTLYSCFINLATILDSSFLKTTGSFSFEHSTVQPIASAIFTAYRVFEILSPLSTSPVMKIRCVYLPPANEVCPQGVGGVHGGGSCVVAWHVWQEGHAWQGGHAWQVGMCIAGGVHGGGACVAGGCMACTISPPPADTTRYGQWAGGTHPTGMHSCFVNFFPSLLAQLFLNNFAYLMERVKSQDERQQLCHKPMAYLLQGLGTTILKGPGVNTSLNKKAFQ